MSKISFFYMLLFLFITIGFNAQQMQIELDKREQTFDYGWKFALGDYPDGEKMNFDDTDWEEIILPYDWSVTFPIDSLNPSSGAGGYFKDGMGWYRNVFFVPKDIENKQVSIHFGGVYMKSEVFINGRSLGIYPYGYSPFDHDLTPYLNYGEKNTIAVKVDNSQQINSRWFSGSGIYRHVTLKITDPLHISDNGVAITTPVVSADNAQVQVKV